MLQAYRRNGRLAPASPLLPNAGTTWACQARTSATLKEETGMGAQEHIHHFVVNKAKNQLLNSNDTVGQIAYSLGFEYPQHFSRVFKAKTA